MSSKFLNAFINLFFPVYCYICTAKIDDNIYGGICPACWGKIKKIPEPHCEQCFQPGERGICGECKKGRHFKKVLTAGVYEGVLRDIIHLYKYNKKEQLSGPLAEFIYHVLKANNIDTDYILVPVPLHKQREKERGYNQSGLMACYLKEKYKYPISENNLTRKINTPSQTNLNKDQRLKNLEAAFKVNYPEHLKGRKFLLIDDVCTTGSTLNLCAKELMQNGAREVMGVVIAR